MPSGVQIMVVKSGIVPTCSRHQTQHCIDLNFQTEDETDVSTEMRAFLLSHYSNKKNAVFVSDCCLSPCFRCSLEVRETVMEVWFGHQGGDLCSRHMNTLTGAFNVPSVILSCIICCVMPCPRGFPL